MYLGGPSPNGERSRVTTKNDNLSFVSAQDTNGVVLELARCQKSQLVCVGDRWQSIYKWRGAQSYAKK